MIRTVNISYLTNILNPDTKVSMFVANVCRKVYFPAHLFGQYLRDVCVRPRVSNGCKGGGGLRYGGGGFINCDVPPPDQRCLETKIFITTSASHLSTSFCYPAPDYSLLSLRLWQGRGKPSVY